MKLDRELIERLIKETYNTSPDEQFDNLCERLETIDLVVKPGDSSQSILVENK